MTELVTTLPVQDVLVYVGAFLAFCIGWVGRW